MIKKKVTISLALVGVVAISLFGYKVFANGKQQAKAAPLTQVTTQQKDQLSQVNQSIENNIKQTNTQQQSNIPESKIQEAISKGQLTDVKENGIYAKGEPLIIGRELMAGLENYRISANQISLSQYKYLLIIDFSLINISKSDYLSNPNNFILSDSNGYTFSPTNLANITGDISGVMKPKDTKRGEIAFEVPANDRDFELTFKTGLTSIKKIRFNIDINPLIDQAQQRPPAVYQAPY